MRLARILGALLALILSATLTGPALVPPAGALASKPPQQIKVKGYEAGNTNRFYIKGKVVTFPKRKIRILRNVSGGPYTVYKKVRTHATGKFKTQIFEVGHKKTCFKVRVPATDLYKKTTVPVGCITTT